MLVIRKYFAADEFTVKIRNNGTDNAEKQNPAYVVRNQINADGADSGYNHKIECDTAYSVQKESVRIISLEKLDFLKAGHYFLYDNCSDDTEKEVETENGSDHFSAHNHITENMHHQIRKTVRYLAQLWFQEP